MPRESLSPSERAPSFVANAWSATKTVSQAVFLTSSSVFALANTDAVSAQEKPGQSPIPLKKEEEKKAADPLALTQSKTFLTQALAGREKMEDAWKHLERNEPESIGVVILYMRDYADLPRAYPCHQWLVRRAVVSLAAAKAVLAESARDYGMYTERILRDAGAPVVPLPLGSIKNGDPYHKTAKSVLALLGSNPSSREAMSQPLSDNLFDLAQKKSSDSVRSSAYILFSTHQWEALAKATASASASAADGIAWSIEHALREAGDEFYPAQPELGAKVNKGVLSVLYALRDKVPSQRMEDVWSLYRETWGAWEQKNLPKKGS